MERKEKVRLALRLAVSAAVIALLALTAYLLIDHFGLSDIDREQIQSYVESTGAVAPLIFIAISFAQVTLIPIPGAVTILAGNYLFGPFESFLYSYVGMMLGAMAAYYLGRLIGRPFVNWIAGGKQKADEWIGRLKGREKIVMFFMFLLPLFPDDLLCAIAGLFRYTSVEFLVLQLITRATSIGGTLLFMSGEVIPYNGFGIALIASLALIAVLGFVLAMKNYERIEKKLTEIFKRRK